MKKIGLSTIWALVCLTASAFDFQVGDMCYNVLPEKDNAVEVTSCNLGWNCYSEKVVVPDSVSYNNVIYRVTSIGESAFEHCRKLKEVYLPNSITEIKKNAFKDCVSLEILDLPNSVEYIGESALYGTMLTSVTIPTNCKHIGEGAFMGSPIREIIWNAIALENSKEPMVWFGCEECDTYIIGFSVYFGDSVRVLPDYLFENMRIKDVILPDNVEEVGKAFMYSFSRTPIYNSRIFAYLPRNYSGEFTIPDGITSIAEGAFMECENLTSVKIPASVEYIGEAAFYSMTEIKSIFIPKNVSHISPRVFGLCENLTTIIVDEQNMVYDSRGNSNAVITRKDNVLVSGCNSTKIPSTVKVIEEYAFEGCMKMKKIRIPSSVQNIKNRAFMYCESLRKMYLDSDLEVSPSWFFGCQNVKIYTKDRETIKIE